tara:strand:- start:186 stop:635 length:450 start_codon:yes stop_codon:yes gene_type:complete
MKITKTELKSIIKEELGHLQELGPETGHEEGTKALDIVKQIGDDLIEVAGEMREMPSHVRAQEMAGYTESVGKELLEAHAELAGGALGEVMDYGKSDQFASALYAIEDNVEQWLYGTDLEPLVKQLTKALKAKLALKENIKNETNKSTA